MALTHTHELSSDVQQYINMKQMNILITAPELHAPEKRNHTIFYKYIGRICKWQFYCAGREVRLKNMHWAVMMALMCICERRDLYVLEWAQNPIEKSEEEEIIMYAMLQGMNMVGIEHRPCQYFLCSRNDHTFALRVCNWIGPAKKAQCSFIIYYELLNVLWFVTFTIYIYTYI